MAETPAKYAEIEQQLGSPLASFIAARRDAGTSWRRIADEIGESTGVEVSHEALRMWTLGRPAVGSESAA